MGKLYSLISALLLTISATFAATPDSYEWWFDHDVSSAQSGTVAGGKVDLQIDTSDLPKGIHYFNLRLADGGSYGSVYRKMFHSFGRDNGAISYEYWFDSDYDAKQTGSLNVGSNHLDLDISSLPKGAHYYNIRLGYGDGSWGTVYRKMVLNLAGNVNAVAYEYWIDNNYSAKTEGTLAPGANSYTVDLTGVRRGLHRFNYRLMTGEGVWGAPFTSYFYSESNAARFTQYEYWLDNDYANHVTGNATGNPTSFEVDLSNFDKSGGAHYFHLRTRDGDGDWSPVYRQLLVFNKTEKRQPIIGYRHYLDGTDLGYVEVERQFVDSYMFEVNLPDSLMPSVRNRKPSFDGDRVFLAGADSIDYTMQVRTEFGWAAPQNWKLGIGNDFSTTAVAMEINSRHTFAAPADLGFAAMKFTAAGDSLYFRSDIPVALDIYKGGERVAALTPAQVKGMAMLRLEAGEYFGVLYGVEDAEAKEFTLHLMDTPNRVPMPNIEYKDAMVNITCTRADAQIRYTLDNNEPDEKSELFSQPFPLKRNAVIKAKAWVPDSDIEPSAVAEFTIDSYKVATPKGSFDVKTRLLTLTCDTVGATILYSFDETREGEWTPYSETERIRMRKNGTVYAKATFDGYHDSDVAAITVSELPNEVVRPEILCDGNIIDGSAVVVIKCATEGAEIRYSFDDEEPTMESALYEKEFPITRNVRVNAFAYVPDLDIEPSMVSSILCDIFRVADLHWNFNPDTRMLTIECDTKDAKIFYTFDPNGEWLPFEGSLEIKKNCTLYAKAVRDGYYDSETEIITINSLADSVPVPVISFENGMVEISCANEAAEIHYTIDNPDITTESPLYTEAFRLDRNATIRALAVIPGLDIEPSDIVTRVIDSFKVATPTGSFDPPTRLLRITCSTEQAKILYSVDSENDWTEYGDPISITRNCTVYAKATRDGWNDSDVAPIQVTELADNVPAPVISFEDGMVEITCSNTSAEIHYTIDDENLTAESPRYEGRFALDRNATIRAFSLIPGLDIEPSGIVTRVIDSFKVATPTGSFDPQTRLLRIICSTEQAKILYSVDSENDWTEYGDPISITRNCTVYAEATRDGWNDSDVASIQVTELADNVPAPVISFEDGMVEITCSNTSAEIHYTIDDENLTAESPRYEGRFALDRNATIRAFALIPDLDIEPSGIVTRVIDSFKAATPYGDFNAGTRMLTILCDTEDASIFYSYDRNEDWIPYTGPIAIEGNRTVYAKATRDGWNDSEIADIVISDVKCAGVSIDYKGHNVTLKTDEEGATIRYTTDGNEPSGGLVYTEPFDPEGLCTVRAVAVKSGYMNSDIAEEVITRYADEEHAETSAEGLLASAFDWDESGLPNKVESFRVAGRLNDADYEFLRSMEALRHLDLEDVADARIPENAFRDTRLISISLPEDITACGDGILAETPTLSSVIWNSRTMNVGDGFIRDLTNPNTLLYVTKEASVSGADGLNIVREGVEPSVTLHYGYPYYAARDFRAARVSLTHEFLQTTKVDTCRGWETIVLPFTPTSITHEVNGPIVPFAAWNEDVEGDKPFWLYSATETGWEAGDSIRACVPYIISMPNNPDYVKEFILGGKVTFSADGVYLGPDSSFADSNPWMEGMRFEGTFMPVEDSNLHSLNVNSTEGGLQPGSKFIPGGSTPPFGAYVSGGPSRRAIPLFGNSDLVDVPLIVDAGLLIETPAPGVLKICSGRECKVAVTTATGVTLRTLHLKPGEAQTLEGLTRDLYIVAGRKVMVR